MEKLPTHIGKEAAGAVAAVTGTSAEAVGLALSKLIPNIIAKPLELDASAGVFDAQMAEIERSLRRTVADEAGRMDRTIVVVATELTGKQMRVRVGQHATVAQLKKSVAAKSGASPDQIDIVINRRLGFGIRATGRGDPG